jgi:hypothetical protein
MKDISKFLILLVVSIFCLQCSNNLTAKEYVQYYEKNKKKYCKNIERNGIVATVCYVPSEYYAARDISNGIAASTDSTFARYKNSLYFVVLFKSKNGAKGSVLLQKDGIAGFKDNVLQNTFGRDQDIFLLHGNDTIKAATFNYERNWGMGTADVFTMVFPRSRINESIKNAHLIVRNFLPEFGTIDVSLKGILRNPVTLRG